MSTRKRKQDEELVALPSDESEEEEECVHHLPYPSNHPRTAAHQQGLNCHLCSSRVRRSASMRRVADAAASFAPGTAAFQRVRVAELPGDSHHRDHLGVSELTSVFAQIRGL
jgi:hypothetical protein